MAEVQKDGLVGYWSFDEGQGTTAYDGSGKGNDGTLNNFDWNANSGWITGKYNGALQFDGTDDYVDSGNRASLNPSSITISMWLYLASNPNCDANNNWRSLLHKGITCCTTTGYDIIMEEGRNVAWDTGNNGGDRWWPSGVSIPIGQWTQLVLTFDSTGMKKAYQDGLFKDSKTVAASSITPNANNLWINNPSVACPNGDGNFNGIIDDVKIYNKALTPDDTINLKAA
ncbi:Concanavalin A-like lectin/glucanases superfamily protein [uncultured archaeon]|nr:Concanavalin A-like lectin/glucanases superfamily protein [uncultured archaeon]